MNCTIVSWALAGHSPARSPFRNGSHASAICCEYWMYWANVDVLVIELPPDAVLSGHQVGELRAGVSLRPRRSAGRQRVAGQGQRLTGGSELRVGAELVGAELVGAGLEAASEWCLAALHPASATTHATDTATTRVLITTAVLEQPNLQSRAQAHGSSSVGKPTK